MWGWEMNNFFCGSLAKLARKAVRARGGVFKR